MKVLAELKPKCWLLLALLLVLSPACLRSRGHGLDGDAVDAEDDGTNEVSGDASTEVDATVETEVDTSDVIVPLGNTGCPATTGAKLSGVARIETLHPTPRITGPDVLVKFPCGRELDDPSKDTCGHGQILVWLCTSPDCSAAFDPVRTHINPEGQLDPRQTSFDSEPFEFCGLSDGTYYLLPIVDHDGDEALTDMDWTMGIKNLGSTSVSWPARVAGYEVSVAGADVTLPTALASSSAQASPVVVNYFYYRHPTPIRPAEPSWLFMTASMHPDVSTTGVGVRALDLQSGQEFDQIAGPNLDAASLALDGARYEGDLETLARDDHTVFLGTDRHGVILSVALSPTGAIQQGHTIDLRNSGITFGSSDVSHHAAVGRSPNHDWLLVANREIAGKPMPHQPRNPLFAINIDNLATADITDAVALNSITNLPLDKVRFDEVAYYNGVFYAAETGKNSQARQDGLNRLWAFKLTDAGQLSELNIYDGPLYNAEGDVSECGTNPPYRRAGLWVGSFNGKTHAFLGGLRTVSVWSFTGDDPAAGLRIQSGSGVDLFDPRLDDYSVGYSLMRPSPDGNKLFVFGDCKSRWLASRQPDYAGTGGTQSRRRVAVLDLSTADADGLPPFDTAYGDRASAPDVVRASLSATDETLSQSIVMGIGMDCRAVLWDIYDVFGYSNVAGHTFGSDCIINQAADAVITDKAIYVIGEGSQAFGTTGLGVSSELLVLDLASGREVLDPNWQWFYEGSAFENRFGYFGLTVGERDTTDTIKGLFLVDK
ncbi:MAG: hypothetical protein AUK47_03315 [Deltaproteobacteria bacterium CG2_30_63_29]|nr:MAG: hypothetical protein AUK47_03315 [Deltaproteobacteria bacterium CG2_30_63_29]PJB36001.1 MAG: hypothetical protein CO108_24410 [Deltaproteobacteria bacterium CG_4_9_14_3_um_filter_63_12]